MGGIRLVPCLTLLSLLASCTSFEPPQPTQEILLEESDALPRLRAEWAVAGGALLQLRDGTLRMVDGEGEWTLADRVIGPVALDDDGDRLAYCRRGDGVALSSIEVWEHRRGGAWTGPRVLAGGDRPALSPDGETVAFVSGHTGIASVWVMPFAGGEPIQLTNRDLTRIPGQAPEGFVPPPHRGPLRFDGDRLVWESPDGGQEVGLP